MEMSRSTKRTPVCGMTGAPSEKQDKRLYNRRYRRMCKQVLHVNPACELLPHLREYSNPWAMDKDGKWWFDPKERPELMRK
jgi:hypothetical protein